MPCTLVQPVYASLPFCCVVQEKRAANAAAAPPPASYVHQGMAALRQRDPLYYNKGFNCGACPACRQVRVGGCCLGWVVWNQLEPAETDSGAPAAVRASSLGAAAFCCFGA